MSVVGFESSMIIWINVGGMRMLYMSLAFKLHVVQILPKQVVY